MTPNQLKVASIQMVSTPSVDKNLANAKQLIEEAKLLGAELVVLPEYFCFMGQHESDKNLIKENFDQGPIQSYLSSIAKSQAIYLVAGTIPLKATDENKVKNSTLVFSPNGEIISRYDKIHLFGFKKGDEEYQESRTIEAGHTSQSFVINVNSTSWKFGLSVCYDIRFPELYRAIGEVDCHIIPAAFTHTTGKAHWEILLRARAIENQCYVLASAQGGQHENGRSTWGQSMLVDPWGEIKSQITQGPGVVMGVLDKSMTQQVRTQLPALLHRTL
jgi:predicted amidohydrolase